MRLIKSKISFILALQATSLSNAFVPKTPKKKEAINLGKFHESNSRRFSGEDDTGIKLEYDPISTSNLDKYKHLHAHSIKAPEAYWGDLASSYLHWFHPFNPNQVKLGDFADGDTAWFAGGKINMCYNAIDRHVGVTDHPALIWEGDEPDDIKSFTYSEMLVKISKIANALKSVGVKKGDKVTIYMPMIPELAMTMLACARIGEYKVRISKLEYLILNTISFVLYVLICHHV